MRVYPNRLLHAPGDPDCADLEKQLSQAAADSGAGGHAGRAWRRQLPVTDGMSRLQRQVAGAGRNPPQEKPQAFVDAAL
ncbi:82ca89e2-a8ec-49db-9af1-798da1192c1e [Thermothielavioides terrestris]|uniref:82ca89e2-a8ec-49db-9af1-798da1192c1e n=1 Tax=Thermothielavioides terrestris TaxID=2587410 RepID=A0A446BVX3_9PEZI|nr:82ca89e2-a8ec-49db-9af1-798da1192c1e [Thermothielavioides terrestris]